MNLPLNKSAAEVQAFLRAPTDDQRQALIGQRLHRSMAIQRADLIDQEKRTAWLSIASELPYERWWGIEILDCSKRSIRTERLKLGAPLLVGHDTADQVGVVEDFEITSDKKLRYLVRFGRSARAEEIFRDVLDGIRRNTSVGYIIHDLVLEKQDNGVSTYRVIDWEPYEGSLVPVPADPSVGVGRQAGTISLQGKKMKTEESNSNVVADAVRVEQRRVQDLLTAGREFQNQGGMEIAQELISIPEANTETFRQRLLANFRAQSRGQGTNTAQPFSEQFEPLAGREAYYGEAAREMLPQPKYFKGEGAQEKAYRAGMWFRALVGRNIPKYRDDRVERWVHDQGLARSMSEGVLSEGGALVPDELSPAIIDLADQYGAYRQNSDVYRMRGDTLSVPKSTGDPEAAFVNENGALGETSGTWGNVNLLTKKIGSIIRVSSELVEDSVIDVADRLAFQLGRAFAKKEDECGFMGDATSTYGGMSGVFKLLADSDHTASKVTAATNHDIFSEIDAADLSNLMAALPEYAHEGAKWYCSQVAWSLVFWRLMAAANGNAISDLAGKVPKSYGGYPVVTCPVLPAGNATDYSGLTMIAFGNLRMASKFGSRRDIRIQVLNETYAAYDQIGVMGTERFHIVNHDCGTNSVAGPMVGLVGA